MDYNDFLKTIRSIIQNEEAPLGLNEGKWVVKDRKNLVNKVSPRLFDPHLDTFKECALEVLTEINPEFELAPEERHAAAIHYKTPKYSHELRTGLADFLAILGNMENPKNFSRVKSELISLLTIREIFNESDWKLWGSLNDLLPTLAEASPREFINSVQVALKAEPCPFDELFSQVGGGVMGRNYLTGLLWGLEKLAWHEEYIVRVASILGEMATHDPGGNWENRPINSLTTLLLPWAPQTKAAIDKRVACLTAIQRDFPDIAWTLVLTLLPNQHQASFGNSKPIWINPLPEDHKINVTPVEYQEQITAYSNIAVDMADGNIKRLIELANHLDNLPGEAFSKALDSLSKNNIVSLDEKVRLPVWITLIDFVVKHRKYSYTDWSLAEKYLKKIDAVANKLIPLTAQGISRRLFRERDFDLCEDASDYTNQQNKLKEKRIASVKSIINEDGLEGLLEFVQQVENPYVLGLTLGALDDIHAEDSILPHMLVSNSQADKIFSKGYVWSRRDHQGWDWVKNIFSSEWTHDEKLALLFSVPVDKFIWNRLDSFLGECQNNYWKDVDINPYAIEDIEFLIPKLLDVNRGIVATNCLNTLLHKDKLIDLSMAKNALLMAVNDSQENGAINPYNAVNLIKHLQSNENFSEEDMCQIEWAYLPLLNRSSSGKEPRTLFKRLATNPDFYCDVIRILDKSKNKDAEATKHSESTLNNTWKLLYDWNRPPGLSDKGEFVGKQFTSWYNSVVDKCEKSGHLEVAKIHIGEVLFYTPADPDGLWINRDVAAILNSGDSEDILNGFVTEIYNSRGVHVVDPTGKPELDLAEEWLTKANALDSEGLARFSEKLREVSDSYKHDAKRIQSEPN